MLRCVAFVLCTALVTASIALCVTGSAKIVGLAKNKQSNYQFFSLPDIISNKPYGETQNFKRTFQSDVLFLADQYLARYGDESEGSDSQAATWEENLELAYEYIAEGILDYAAVAGDSTWDVANLPILALDASPGGDFASDDAELEYAIRGIGTVESVYSGSIGSVAMDYPFSFEPGGNEYIWSFSSHTRFFPNSGGLYQVENGPVVFDLSSMLRDPAIVVQRDLTSDDGLIFTELTVKSLQEPGVRQAFETLYAEQLSEMREVIAQAYITEMETASLYLKNQGLRYYIGNGEASYTNVPLGEDGYPKELEKSFLNEPAYFIYENGAGRFMPEVADEQVAWMQPQLFDDAQVSLLPADLKVYMAMEADAFYAALALLETGRAYAAGYYPAAVACLMLSIALFVWLCIFTGRRREDGSRQVYAIDRVFTEVQVLFATGVLAAVAWGGAIYYSNHYDFVNLSIRSVYAWLGVAAIWVALALVCWCALSLVRGMKTGLFWKQSLVWRFLRLIWRGFLLAWRTAHVGFSGRSPLTKTILLVALLWFFSFSTGLASASDEGFIIFSLCVPVAAVLFSCRWIGQYRSLKQGIEEIASGHSDYRIPVSEKARSEFENLSKKVNTVGSATAVAIASELKSQRLKTDLIANVSHDLRTPLTSIITYTDLLKTEGLGSVHAPEYLDVIDQKSKQLKKLTDDLFDASKASSGAINVQADKIDLKALVNQGLAEMNARLMAAKLEIVLTGLADHFYILADGNLMWRVLDNLLTNVEKYAQPGTRIYIDIKTIQMHQGTGGAKSGFGDPIWASRPDQEKKGASGAMPGTAFEPKSTGTASATASGSPDARTAPSFGGLREWVVMEIKNVSRAQLNIAPDELMERFMRGDESRTTEGSGLGLAIARDLIRLQGGRLDIGIDGDLFKATVTLPAC